MANNCEDFHYMIGTIPQRMMSLRDMRLPAPDQVVYRPTAVHYVRGDFSRVGDGFASTEWIWDMISIPRLSNLLSFLDGETYANVYIVTDKRDGTFPNPRSAFSMFYCMMWKPVLSGDEGVSVAKSPYVMQTVKLQFVNMVEVGGYL